MDKNTYVLNPKTNRLVLFGKPTHKKLKAEGYNLATFVISDTDENLDFTRNKAQRLKFHAKHPKLFLLPPNSTHNKSDMPKYPTATEAKPHKTSCRMLQKALLRANLNVNRIPKTTYEYLVRTITGLMRKHCV